MIPKNVCCRSSKFILASHTNYFRPRSNNVFHRALPALFWWVMHPHSAFAAVGRGEDALVGKCEANIRKARAMLQWICVLVIGLIIWPYSIIVVARPILSMAGTFLFFDNQLSKRTLDFWEEMRQFIANYAMSDDYMLDIWHACVILGGCGSNLDILRYRAFLY